MKKIATITSYTYLMDKFSLHSNKKYKSRNSRIVGFFDTIEKAENLIIEKSDMLFEYTYEYIVIEVLEEGLYPSVLQEKWFIYDKKLSIYHPSLKPKDLENCISFSIG